jgi:hypothetical protein
MAHATAIVATLLVALPASACGGSADQPGSDHRLAESASPRQVALATPAASADGHVDAQLVNAVCQAIRRGVPAALAPPFTTARISRHLNEVQPVARRVEVSLRRMARRGGGPGLRRLVRAVASLRALYAATPALMHDAAGAERAGQQVAAQERAVGVTAADAGFPACGLG